LRHYTKLIFLLAGRVIANPRVSTENRCAAKGGNNPSDDRL
jgi:hypothetical protein